MISLPLVVVGVKAVSGANTVVKATGRFALNRLSKEQKGLALAFFKPAKPEEGKISGKTFNSGANGTPIMDAAIAAVKCSEREIVEIGDHNIVIAEITDDHLPKPIEGRPDAAILEIKDLGDNVFYGG